MSLLESKESNGSISLKSLFDGNLDISSTSSLSIDDLSFAICRGEWPASVSMPKEIALDTSVNYVEADPTIAAAVLGTNPVGILKDFNTFGFLFESLCTRDLRIYSEANGGSEFYYRDRYDFEANIIVSLRDGRWVAVEVKLGQKQIEEAAENL